MTAVRQPIANQPERGRTFGRPPRLRFMYPLLPQRAWLQGTVLIVERFGEVSECDLATADRIKIGSVNPLSRLMSWSFQILYAYWAAESEPTRLVLTGPDWYLLTGDEYRLLATILSARPDSGRKKISKIIRRLKTHGAYEDFRSQGPDWSFRTNPRGSRDRDRDSR